VGVGVIVGVGVMVFVGTIVLVGVVVGLIVAEAVGVAEGSGVSVGLMEAGAVQPTKDSRNMDNNISLIVIGGNYAIQTKK
jgi:hypothetical protein